MGSFSVNTAFLPPPESYVFECVYWSVCMSLLHNNSKSDENIFLIFFMFVGPDQSEKGSIL